MVFPALICFVIVTMVTALVLLPHFQLNNEPASLETQSRSALNDQRERCVQVIKDLELDLATGKLSDEEYQRMRASVGHELLAILDKLKST